MSRGDAVERIMRDLSFGEGLRYFVEKRVAEMVDYADTMDRYTFDALKDAIRREVLCR